MHKSTPRNSVGGHLSVCKYPSYNTKQNKTKQKGAYYAYSLRVGWRRPTMAIYIILKSEKKY
jgi:hypothetical protein